MMIRLEFDSRLEMLDLVQSAADHVGRSLQLDDDTRHFVGVAVRESVVNAIRHGNLNDPGKRVAVAFSTRPGAGGVELLVQVRDEGQGFDPATLADPLAPENVLKPSGRGIFLIRSFMDDVQLQGLPGGGMEIRMIKRLPRASAAR